MQSEIHNDSSCYRRRYAATRYSVADLCRTVTTAAITLAPDEHAKRCKCESHGVHFFACKKTSRKQYCSNACRQQAYRDRNPHEPTPIPYVDSAPCLCCETVSKTTRPKSRLYCGPKCRQRMYRIALAEPVYTPMESKAQ